jgi:hypothetical protein
VGLIPGGVTGQLFGCEQVRTWQVAAENGGDTIGGRLPGTACPHGAANRRGQELGTGAAGFQRGRGGGYSRHGTSSGNFRT